jgi:hypothetical protein
VGNLRDPAAPSAPSDTPPVTKHENHDARVPDEELVAPSLPTGDLGFAEFFAGEGQLSQAMHEAGATCREPDDLATGCADFEEASQVKAVRA